ncbi:ribonuclease J [Vermiculatibacterium agrestimuris]|uniref:ribonuclease J n=1 Tax=Vermiculatibacterium agrestimuris TaxID=2941519 RepID=UPI00203EBFDA|nr:ribonuclease J [Vermiculatibacterium agrestimuris]
MAEKLKIISLGGLNEIGKNMTVYEYGGDMIVVDAGMGFPDDDMYGIDVVIPDFTYLIKNRDKIRGVFITHGHEDHIGSLPYLLRELNVPVYATRMSAGLIQLKLEEHHLLGKTKLITCEAGETVKAGRFSVEFIHVNHSIADAVAFAIKTPVGLCLHTGDFKIDATPVSGGMIDLARLGQLGKEGVLAMLCDSTNVEQSGFTKSERSVGASFDALFRGCEERIIIATFASNVDRIQQIVSVAARYGRKVAITGRSMENAIKVSTELGYMSIPAGTLVDINQIKGLPKNKVCIVTTGSQGETMSAMTRMAFNTHRQVEIQAGDRVIFSASAIPGNENAIGNVVNELYRKGAEVVNERAGALHVSGHACADELKIIHALVKPRFFIPVHGEQRMLKVHAKLAQEMGMDPRNIVISDIGKVIELSHNAVRMGGVVPAGRVFVDGYGVGDVGAVVLRDRKHLAEDGMIVVVASVSAEDGGLLSGPDIITRGFVYVKESEGLMEELKTVALEAMERSVRANGRDWTAVKGDMKNDISGYLFKKTRRNPMILPVIMEV